MTKFVRRKWIKNQTSVWQRVDQLVIGGRYRPLDLEKNGKKEKEKIKNPRNIVQR